MRPFFQLLCIIPLFIGLPITVFSEDWSELFGTELGDVVYVNKSSIKIEDNIVSGTFLINYPTTEPFNNALSNVQDVSFDCNTSQFQVLNDKFFSNQNAKGKLLQDSNWPMPKMGFPKGSSWELKHQYMCSFLASSTILNSPYNELIERIQENNQALITLGFSTTFSRIDACKQVATNEKDDYALNKWKAAEVYFNDVYLHYYSLARLMSYEMNLNVPDAVNISVLDSNFEESETYKSMYKQTLKSNECFDFGDGSIYLLMGDVGLGVIHMYSKLTWDRFKLTFPESATTIVQIINERFPDNFVFE